MRIMGIMGLPRFSQLKHPVTTGMSPELLTWLALLLIPIRLRIELRLRPKSVKLMVNRVRILINW